MNETNKDLDFLTEVQKRISERSKISSAISPEEVIDLFHDTLEGLTDVKIIETPVFLPFNIEREDELFVARCHAYKLCRGQGLTEEEAIQNLKDEIENYYRVVLRSEKMSKIEEMIKNVFPKDNFQVVGLTAIVQKVNINFTSLVKRTVGTLLSSFYETSS